MCRVNATGDLGKELGVGPAEYSALLGSLVPFTAYAVQVSAYTVDSGVLSQPVIVWTDEDGNNIFLEIAWWKDRRKEGGVGWGGGEARITVERRWRQSTAQEGGEVEGTGTAEWGEGGGGTCPTLPPIFFKL